MLKVWSLLFFVGLGMSMRSHGSPSGNQVITNFNRAKKLAIKIHQEHPLTIYCHCRYSGKTVDLKSCGYVSSNPSRRTTQLEWEHVVPAENFGRSFSEWRDGAPQCRKRNRKFKGRKCAETNPNFAKMEADLYNLWPEIGELNGLRSHYSFAELGAEQDAKKSKKGDFGQCQARVADRKFEPMPFAKGQVARVYFYMDQVYPGHGIISDKNRKLFEAWDKLHPVDDWECLRAKKIEAVQKNINLILEKRCRK